MSFLPVFMNTASIHASKRLLIEMWFTDKCFSLHQVFISTLLKICTLTILMVVWCEIALFSPEVMKYFRHPENRADSLCKNVIVGLSSLVALQLISETLFRNKTFANNTSTSFKLLSTPQYFTWVLFKTLWLWSELQSC